MEWLGDRVLTHFGRHRAPLVESPELARDEQAFVLMSLIPNRKGQPLLVEWQAATRRVDAQGRGTFTLEPFTTFAQRSGLAAGRLPNPGPSSGTELHDRGDAAGSAIRHPADGTAHDLGPW